MIWYPVENTKKDLLEISTFELLHTHSAFKDSPMNWHCIRPEHWKMFRVIHEVEVWFLQDIFWRIASSKGEVNINFMNYFIYMDDKIENQLHLLDHKYILLPKPVFHELCQILCDCTNRKMFRTGNT